MKNNFKVGKLYFIGEEPVLLEKFLNFKKAIVKKINLNESDVVELNDLSLESKVLTENVNDNEIHMLDSISDKDWETAQNRFSIIKPIIEKDKSGQFLSNRTEYINSIAKENGISKATIYRWLLDYNSTELVSSLVPKEKNGGKGEGRLESNIELILNDCIREVYLNSHKKSKTKVIQEVKLRCSIAGLEAPHENTIRNRIARVSQFEKFKTRAGKALTENKVSPVPGKFTLSKYPLDVVQIDHTLLDIIVVSDEDRIPIGRPWITLAIDVYSRMVTGLHISLDPPGSHGTGICISNSILPKDFIIAKYDLKSDWPVFGVMETIHMDNAKEFRGIMLQRACKEYSININWRAVKKPHWGSYIERLLGTLAKDIHALPGTTFSNFNFRKNYDSEKRSAMTLEELEKWIYTYIVDVYHQRIHSGINTSPINKYSEGIFGSGSVEGVGIQTFEFDEEKIKLDFMPFFERTIRRTGVTIDKINYYHEILKQKIYESYSFRGDEFVKSSVPKKYIFKRDPRDISKIYFLDDSTKKYISIPYADASKPGISIWEYKEAINHVKKNNQYKEINSEKIFEAHMRLKEIETGAKKLKREAKKNNRERKLNEFYPTKKSEINTNETPIQQDNIDFGDLKPFETDDRI